MESRALILLVAASIFLGFAPPCARAEPTSAVLVGDFWKQGSGLGTEPGLSRFLAPATGRSACLQGMPEINVVHPHAVLDQAAWSSDFHADGMDDRVWHMTVFQGQLYLGGGFRFAGSARANHIVGWDGEAWSILGSGMNHVVHALQPYRDELVATGWFTEAGGAPAHRIATWNGRSWRAFPSAVDDDIRAMTEYRGWLIAGGDLQRAGEASVRHIARWDGARWQPLVDDSTGVDGVNGEVHSLTVFRDELIVSGDFWEAGGIPSRGVARWNGSSWKPLGTGVNTSNTEAVCVYEDQLIVGGYFTSAGDMPMNGIASWDGTSWHALGSGVGGITVPLVRSLAVFRGDLIAGGIFTTAGDNPANAIARWDGQTWHPLGSGIRFLPWDPPLAEVRTLAVYDDRLYAGGLFFVAGETRANDIASWDGSTWEALDPGLGVTGIIYNLAVSGSDLVAGGGFIHAGSRPANRIARLVEDHWEPLGAGTDDDVRAVMPYDGTIIAGGEFLQAGGTAASHVASWDGAQWRPMGLGLDGVVYSLCTYRDTVIAAGGFTGSGSTVLNRVAGWDGVQWLPLGTGMSDVVASVHVLRDTLYACGFFEAADGAPARRIAFWTGSGWRELGGGTDGPVIGLGSYGGKLVIGGGFLSAGLVSARRIALWDGAWHALGEGVDLGAFAFSEYGNSLYVGGNFNFAGGMLARSVARWDGSQWHTLGEGALDGDGVEGTVYTMATFAGGVYLGGTFSVAGGIRSTAIARWDATTPVAIQDFHGWCDEGVTHLRWLLSDAFSATEVSVERSGRLEGPYETRARLPVAGRGTMEFADADPRGCAGWYRLQVSTTDGAVVLSELVQIVPGATQASSIVAIDRGEGGSISVRYQVAGSHAVAVALRILDVRGRVVRTLATGAKPPGEYVVVWPAAAEARGVYFASLRVDRHTASRKFVLLANQ